MSMVVSHSFTGEHIEDGSGKEGGAKRDHHDIKHGDILSELAMRAPPGSWQRVRKWQTPSTRTLSGSDARVFRARVGFLTDQVHSLPSRFERYQVLSA